MMGNLTEKDYKGVVSNHIIPNCPINVNNSTNSRAIHGPALARGKTVHQAPAPVVMDYVEVPRSLVEGLVFWGGCPVVCPLELVLHLLQTLVVHRRAPLLQGFRQFEPSLGYRLNLFCPDNFLVIGIGGIRINGGGKFDDLLPPRPDRLMHQISLARWRALEVVCNVLLQLCELGSKLVLPRVESICCDLAYC